MHDLLNVSVKINFLFIQLAAVIFIILVGFSFLDLMQHNVCLAMRSISIVGLIVLSIYITQLSAFIEGCANNESSVPVTKVVTEKLYITTQAAVIFNLALFLVGTFV